MQNERKRGLYDYAEDFFDYIICFRDIWKKTARGLAGGSPYGHVDFCSL